MSDLYKFVVNGDTINWFEQNDAGTFEAEDLKLNQTLSFDAGTGDVTLTSTFANYIRLQVFRQTADTTDDPSLYTKPVTSFTTLDGTPIDTGNGGGGGGGGHGGDDLIPELHQHGGRHNLDEDGSDDDSVDGTDGNDDTRGGFGDDHIRGGGGDDHLRGDAGDDTLSGDLGNDTLSGGSGFDDIHGGRGDDRVSGGDDDDIVSGGTGDDSVSGGNGDDHLSGDSGDDVVTGGSGDDDASGGSGDDTIKGDLGDDTLRGDRGNDKIFGGAGDDSISGGADNDRINGDLGNDTLNGNAGDDRLNGGDGNDTLAGGTGADRLTGGLGADQFIFNGNDALGLRNVDRITDFSHAQGDVIDLSGIDADSGTAGDQAFSFIGTDRFTGAAGELMLKISTSKMLLLGDTDGDGTADFAIRIDGTTPLELADLVL
ncbi:calcium-binding protein [Novosphingobium sp.]|uniref:calcium-binding protein n=1 Tax=Novosphingobium sp. TaxID=1874826 RepID=UPI002612F38F|nr:calcium-binding protein [Novosphingobium sp.]